MPLIASKNVSKPSTDLRKMSIINTNLSLNPLVSILKHNSDHAARDHKTFKWVPLAHRIPSALHSSPKLIKSSSQTCSFVSFHAPYWSSWYYSNPTCFPAPAILFIPIVLCLQRSYQFFKFCPFIFQHSLILQQVVPSLHLILLLTKSCYSVLSCYYCCTSPMIF